jgi:hypothetical protein
VGYRRVRGVPGGQDGQCHQQRDEDSGREPGYTDHTAAPVMHCGSLYRGHENCSPSAAYDEGHSWCGPLDAARDWMDVMCGVPPVDT